MKAVWWACGWSALGVLCVLGSAHAQDPTPADKDIAAAIARGVAFLKETQSDEGYWDEPSQRDHRLGMSALAGLALLENGVARDAPAIMRARPSSSSWQNPLIKPTTSRWRSCSSPAASRAGAGKPMR